MSEVFNSECIREALKKTTIFLCHGTTGGGLAGQVAQKKTISQNHLKAILSTFGWIYFFLGGVTLESGQVLPPFLAIFRFYPQNFANSENFYKCFPLSRGGKIFFSKNAPFIPESVLKV